jgi:hypothetical protein
VACLRVADVIDTLVSSDKPTDGATAKRLADGSDAVHAGLGEGDIAATLAEAPKLRGEALMLFR